MEQVLAGEGIPSPVKEQFIELITSYIEATKPFNIPEKILEERFITLYNNVRYFSKSPYNFPPYHEKITAPINLYEFGIEFIKPLTNLKESNLFGSSNLDRMAMQIKKKENVILLGNHQSEFDPQALSLLLQENGYSKLGEISTFVAGHRVVTDPVAVPFSLGRNLLCIHSKRRMDDDPDKKEEKLLHNKRTMKLMSDMLKAGGNLIYVAPSGGRDRPNEQGVVEIAPFDPSSIEMFHLMAKQAKTATHFYPLALSTYKLLPPPNSLQKALGESRNVSYTPLHFHFGDEIDMNRFKGSDLKDKKERRQAKAFHIYNLVKDGYKRIEQ